MSVHRTRKQRDQLQAPQGVSSTVEWHGKSQAQSTPTRLVSKSASRSNQDAHFLSDLKSTAGAVVLASAILLLGWWQLK